MCTRLLSAKPDDVDALHGWATIAFAEGQGRVAAETLKVAISLNPDKDDLYRDLAAALLSHGRSDEAIKACRRAIGLNRDNADTQTALGQIARARGELAEAEAAFRAAVALRHDHALALMNLANLAQEQGRFDEAEQFYGEALRQKPDYAEAHKNYAVALSERGRFDEALASIRQAIRFQPDEPGWRMALGQILLLAGRLELGWKQYEWRWQTKNMPSQPRGFSQPHWTGDNEGERTLLLHAEQGFGDTIQFCRYVSLAAKKARIVLEVPHPLVPLLSGLSGVAQIVPTGAPLPPFDVHCPLLSLPRLFNTTLGNVPAQVPYLAANSDRIVAWKKRLSGVKGLRVGLVWAGGLVTPRNRQRSVAAPMLDILARIPDVHFVSLQKHQVEGCERAPSSLGLIDWTDELVDFGETAALIESLDLVISVDTAVAHLAGALGKPVWLLNRFFPCWRWLIERDDSPWYPTLRQYRQKTLDDWEPVLREVRRDLSVVVGSHNRQIGKLD